MTQLQSAYETIDKLREKLEASHQSYNTTQGQALISLCITQLQNLTAEHMDLADRVARLESFARPDKYRKASDKEEDDDEG